MTTRSGTAVDQARNRQNRFLENGAILSLLRATQLASMQDIRVKGSPRSQRIVSSVDTTTFNDNNSRIDSQERRYRKDDADALRTALSVSEVTSDALLDDAKLFSDFCASIWSTAATKPGNCRSLVMRPRKRMQREGTYGRDP